MNNKDNDVLNRIIRDEALLDSEDEQLRTALARWFDGRRNFCMVYSLAYLLISIGLLWWGLNFLMFAEDIHIKMMGMLLIAVSLSANVTVKLWFWIMDTKIATVKELKKMQLQSLEKSDEPEEIKDALQKSILPEKFRKGQGTFWANIKPKTLEWATFIALLVFGCAAGFAGVTYNIPHRWFFSSAENRVEQVDEWRISSTDSVEARSIIASERWFMGDPILTLDLPVLNAEVESVTFKGAALLFKRIDERRYDVQLPVRGFGEEGVLIIEVQWRFPFQALGRDGDHYRGRLVSLVPANSYMLYIRPESEFAGGGFAAGGKNSGIVFGEAVEDYPALKDFDLSSGHVFSLCDSGKQRQRFGACRILKAPEK